MPAFFSLRLRQLLPGLRLVLALLILALVTTGLIPPQRGQAQANAPLTPVFGPILFSINGPAQPDFPIHARITTVGGDAAIASGNEQDLQTLRDQGYAVQVLDPSTAGRVYYLADATADHALMQAQAVADVLLTGDDVLLLGTTLAKEPALLETLPANGISIALLDAPAAAEAIKPGVEQRSESTGANVAPPDPTVAALLPRLTESDLRTLGNELSGQTPVTVNGASVSLSTRYTLAARLRSAEDYVYQWYRDLGIPVSYFTWQYGAYSGRNVIAEVRGRTNPEQVLIIGGHLDNTSQTPYTLAPGGDDNATGTAATLLIARILRGYTPAITVRYVHFTGEEQGQWGSRVYAAYLRQRGERVLGFINLDMIGWDGDGDRVAEIHTGTGPKSNALGTEFLARNTRYGQGMIFERKMTSASRFSDHSPFWDNDIGAFLVIENFFTDVRARDRNPYYHTTGDLPSRVDYNYVARIGRVALATLTEMAGFDVGGTATATPTPTGTITPQPTATPTTTPAQKPTVTPTATPGACTNLLVNGSFETNTGWRFGATPFSAAYVTSPVYAGVRAVRQGIPSGYANRLAHSSTYQTVAIPANAAAPVLLRFAHRPGGAADGIDYREALLLNTSYGLIARLERSYAAANDQWAVRTFDLTAYRGRTVVLYFNVYNNGAGSQMWTYLDSVQLGPCPAPATAAEVTNPPAPWEAAAERRDDAQAAFRIGPEAIALSPGVESTIHVALEGSSGAAAWHASADGPWLHLAASQGETPGDLHLSADATGLAPGVYQATVTVQDALNPTRTAAIYVELRVGGFSVYLPAVQH